MAYSNMNISRETIPVVKEYGSGNALGRMKATLNLVTNLGTITGFDLNGCIQLNNILTNLYEGEHLEILESNATSWPNNTGDVRFPNRTRSNSQYVQ